MPHAVLPSLRAVEERNALVLAHQGLIWWTWNRHKREKLLRRLGEEDAIAAGQLGLIRAAELWRPEIAEFATYAPRWIYTLMQREAALSLTIQVPADVLSGCAPEGRKSIADRVRRVFSIDHAGDDNDRTWDLAVTHDPSPPWLLDGWEELQEALRFVHPVVREPLLQHYRDGMTYDEIGEALGISRGRVEQLVRAAEYRLCRQLGIACFRGTCSEKRLEAKRRELRGERA